MAGFEFSAKQQSIVTATITLVCVLVVATMLVGLIKLLGGFLTVFGGIFTPLAVAAILALVLKPYYDWLATVVRFRLLAVVLVFLSILVPLGAFLWGFGSLVVEQLHGLFARIPDWFERLWIEAQLRWPSVLRFWNDQGLADHLQRAMQNNAQRIADGLGNVLSRLLEAGVNVFRAVAAMLMWVVFPVYFSYFLVAGPISAAKREQMLSFLKPETRHDAIYLWQEFVSILVSFFRGQVVVALIMGIILAVGFVIVGLQYGLAIGLLMGLLNIIPYLGSLMGLLLVTVVSLTQSGGGFGLLAGALVVIAIVQFLEGNFLTPRIMGQRTGLHPVTIMVAIFFWGTALGGLLGMILAVPLTAFLVVFWRLIKTKYIGEVV
jgi:predicted PurR-regulated permease PerM